MLTDTENTIRELNHELNLELVEFNGHLWTPTYFAVSAGGAPLSIIKQYIENQARAL